MNFIVDVNASLEVKSNLKKYGKIYNTKPIDDLYFPVNSHPDIQIHFIDYKTAVCCPEVFLYYKELLPAEVKLICGSSGVGEGYPFDASYNVARLGNNIVCNLKYIDEVLLELYKEKGYNIIDVKQGYTKCNLCCISDNAAITEDKGIFDSLIKNGIDALKLESKCVKLKNFDYGFIGGASGRIDNCILFTGDIKKHKEYNKIYNFIKKHNMEIVLLSENYLEDFGSIISFL